MCPDAGSSDEQTSVWAVIFGTPIAQRLNDNAPGARLTAFDIPNLLSLCAFESLAKRSRSPFCDLFTSSEFDQFEYFSDLDKFYGTGWVFSKPDFQMPTYSTGMDRTLGVYKALGTSMNYSLV